MDYHPINEYTVKNKYPIPNAKEQLAKLHKKQWFTKLDVQWDTTTYASKKEIDGKPPLKPIMDSLNAMSCSLDYATLQPHFKS